MGYPRGLLVWFRRGSEDPRGLAGELNYKIT